MRDDDKNWFRQRIMEKIQEAFLLAVRFGLNEQKAAYKAANLRRKFPGFSKDALVEILIRRAARKTAAEGAVNGGAITAAEAGIAAPAPEAGQRPALIGAVGGLLVADVAYTTKVQMQLLLEIGEIYECPFSKDDEDDVWLIFKAALGITGAERAGAYSRFIFTEAGEKRFRKFLRDQGRRRAAQEMLRRIAGRKIAKYLSEKVVMRLIAVANAVFGFFFNRFVTRQVGKWAKVRAKIRASTFRGIDELKKTDRAAAIITLPVIFIAGTAGEEFPSDNLATLYAQASNRLELSELEIQQIEAMAEATDLMAAIAKRVPQVQCSQSKSALMDLGITAAAASAVKVNQKQRWIRWIAPMAPFADNPNDKQHRVLLRLSEVLGVAYSKQQLEEKIRYLCQ